MIPQPKLVQTRLAEFDESIVLFDGGQEAYKGWDQYVERCNGGGVHLHIYKLGSYRECYGCRRQDDCRKYAICCAEQAEP